MPIAPKAEDYNPFYGDFLKDEGTARLSAFNAEVTGWAAEMHLEPALAQPSLSAWSSSVPSWRQCRLRHERFGGPAGEVVLQKVGTEEALAELKQRAKAVLGAAKGNTKFFSRRCEQPCVERRVAPSNVGES